MGMGKLRIVSGTHLHPKYIIMNKLVLVCFLAVANAAPVEDTPEVAAAKASFKAAFTVAEAGEHIALAPVNKDVQAAQIPNDYLDDVKEVAEVKAAFDAEFKSVAAGGLAAKQAPAPIHEVAEAVAMPVAPVAYTHVYPAYHHAYPHAYTGYSYGAFPQLATGYAHYGYNGFPVVMPAMAAPVKAE